MKTVLITGADRGLGLAMAKALAKKGFTVFAGRFNTEYDLLLNVAAEDPRIIPVMLDTASDSSIASAYESVCKVTDHLDMAVSDAAYMGGPPSSEIMGSMPIDYELLDYSFQVNSLGALKVMETFLPLLDKGEMKRMCFISSEVSSVINMRRSSGFRYTMSKSALNMAVKILYNTLFDEGYTFRIYHPGWVRRELPDGSLAETGRLTPDWSAAVAVDDFLKDRPDEMRFVMTDWQKREWVF
jgi:NAD(P)-dependent dehydrogenase (short-subunit alcohol dehydrogenase family)